MAEDVLKKLLFGSLLLSLVSVLLLTVVIDVGSTYDKNLSEVTGGGLNIEQFNSSINNLETQAEYFQGLFGGTTTNTSPWKTIIDILGFLSYGMFTILLALFDIILAPIGLLRTVLEQNLGIPTIVTNTFVGLFIVAIIFAVYRIVKVGD